MRDPELQAAAEALERLALGTPFAQPDEPRFFAELKTLGAKAAESGDAEAVALLIAFLHRLRGNRRIWANGGLGIGLTVTYLCKTGRLDVIEPIFEFMGVYSPASGYEHAAWRLQSYERALLPFLEKYLLHGNEIQQLMVLDILVNFMREQIVVPGDLPRFQPRLDELERHPNEAVVTVIQLLRQFVDPPGGS